VASADELRVAAPAGRGSREAIVAALDVARSLWIDCGEPVVVRDLTNVLVHLAPAPVVARVPLTLSLLRGRGWYAQEVELAAWLAREGAPVAAPATEVDPGPHEHGGFLVSLWRWVDHEPERFDPVAAGRSLRELHGALARYPGALPPFDRLDEIERLLDRLEPSPAASAEELARLRAAHARLAARPRPTAERPLHGDSHFRNLLWTAGGPLWGDLENACSGPVEFDLACLTWRGAPGTDEALTAYGPYDSALVQEVTPFLALLLAAWTIVIAQRVPSEGGVAEARRRVALATAYGEAPGA
jgi:aminoglycoside phosphotransferase (APT) family kinase protein